MALTPNTMTLTEKFHAAVMDERKLDHDKAVQVTSESTGLDPDVVLAGRIAITGIERTIQAAQLDEKKARQRADDLAFLELIRPEDLPEHIAKHIVGGMDDDEIRAFDNELREETGKGILDYGKEILGEDAVAKRPDESEAEQRRRVLEELYEEMIEVETGPDGRRKIKIKDKYKDHPLAKRLAAEEEFKEVVKRVNEIDQEVERNGRSAETDAEIDRLKEDKFSTSKTAADNITDDTYKSELRDGEDGHWDGSLVAAKKVTNDTNELDDLFPGAPSMQEAFSESSDLSTDEKLAGNDSGPPDTPGKPKPPGSSA